MVDGLFGYPKKEPESNNRPTFVEFSNVHNSD